MGNNPYQTPESDLEVSSELRRSVWWRVYFFILTILSATGMVALMFDSSAGVAEYVALILWVALTVGLFGFVFLKPIGKPKFWLLILMTNIAYEFIYPFFTGIDLRAGMSDLVFYISNAIGYLILLPSYYAVYSFSRPNNKIWAE